MQIFPEERKLHIYGYSQAFGQANHVNASEIIQRQFKNYEITTSVDDKYEWHSVGQNGFVDAAAEWQYNSIQ